MTVLQKGRAPASEAFVIVACSFEQRDSSQLTGGAAAAGVFMQEQQGSKGEQKCCGRGPSDHIFPAC